MQLIPPSEFTLPFIKKIQISKDAYSFLFDRSKYDFNFYPGQYVRMTLPHLDKDERGDGRFFSIASSPLEDKHIDISTRIIQSSFKKKLSELNPGQDVKFFGPVGRFIFDETELNPRIYLAGGIGITPFKSMIDYVLQKKILTPITLFASFTSREDFVFYDELQEISQVMPSIKIIYTVTKPELSHTPWSGETGRITPDLIKKYSSGFESAISMSCGPVSMLDSMFSMMTELGVTTLNNRKELFTGY